MYLWQAHFSIFVCLIMNLSISYTPASATPSLETNNQWVYWSRLIQITLEICTYPSMYVFLLKRSIISHCDVPTNVFCIFFSKIPNSLRTYLLCCVLVFGTKAGRRHGMEWYNVSRVVVLGLTTKWLSVLVQFPFLFVLAIMEYKQRTMHGASAYSSTFCVRSPPHTPNFDVSRCSQHIIFSPIQVWLCDCTISHPYSKACELNLIGHVCV